MSSKFLINQVITKTDVGKNAREVDLKVQRISSDLKKLATAINHLYGFEVCFDKWIYELNFWRLYSQDGISTSGSAGDYGNEPLHTLIGQSALIYEAHTGNKAPWRLTGGEVQDGAGPFLRLLETCLAFAGDETPKNKVVQAVDWVLRPRQTIEEK